MNENSAYLWHKCLGHISKERLVRLVKNEILSDLDFTDLNICVDCIKGKQTKHKEMSHKKHNFLKLYTLIYVDLLMLLLSVRKNISSLLLMTFHVMDISIYWMKNLKQ